MNKRYIAPIVISALFLIYFFGIIIGMIYFGILSNAPKFMVFLVMAGPAIAAGIMIFVMIQRIEEIKGGEEDEAGKY